MRLLTAVAALSDVDEREAWRAFISGLRRQWGHGWASVIGGYMGQLVRSLPDPSLRRLVDLAAVDPSERPAAVDDVRAAWTVARGGRAPGVPPQKQYQYTVDLRLRAALRIVNPGLAALALPARLPTGWAIWRSEPAPPPPAAPPLPGHRPPDAAELRCLLGRCTSAVERLVLLLFATTQLPPRDVRRLRWDPTVGGGDLFLVRKTAARAVPASPEVRELLAQWRRSTVRSACGFVFPHNSRACVRVGYLTRIVGAVIGDASEAAVAAAIDRIRCGG